ncbi:MAG: hypothetical protein GY950_21255, partial [bacterium]|nr:hypothetical protein [bacterium]
SKLNRGIAIKKHQYFFFNQRPVREKTLIASLNNTFRNFLEKHKSPVAILLIELPPREIDVNIHPMKLEIKLRNSSEVYQFIKHAIETTLKADISFGANGANGANGAGIGTGFNAGGMNDSASFSGPLPGSSGGGGSGGSVENWYHRNPTGDYKGQNRDYNRPFNDEGRQSPAGDFEQAQLFAGDFIDKEDFTIIGQ